MINIDKPILSSSDIYKQIIAFTASVYQVHDAVTKNIKLDNITHVQYKILELLAVSNPLTLSQIAECMNMSMPNASRELKKLSEKNYCEKYNDAEDRRKQHIRLSSYGKAIMDDVFSTIETAFAKRIQDHSSQNMEHISRALSLLQSQVFYTK